MRQLSSLIVAVALAAGAAGAAGAAPAPAPYKAPRTAFGTPDLQGLWTNTAVTFLQRPPLFKSLIATDKEEAMMIGLFKSQAGDIIKTGPVDPKAPAPPVVKEAPQADYIEMDLHLGRINSQARTSWIVEPADGRLPFQRGAPRRPSPRCPSQSSRRTSPTPRTRDTQERCLTAASARLRARR